MAVLIEGTPLRRSPFMDAHAASTFFGALSVWVAVAATAAVALRLAGLRRNFVDVQSRVVSTMCVRARAYPIPRHAAGRLPVRRAPRASPSR